MIDLYYRKERPFTGSVEDICEEVGARTEAEIKSVKKILSTKFVKVNSGKHGQMFKSQRCDEGLKAYAQSMQKACTLHAQKKKAAKIRWQKEREKKAKLKLSLESKGIADDACALHVDSTCNADAMHINQYPIPNYQYPREESKELHTHHEDSNPKTRISLFSFEYKNKFNLKYLHTEADAKKAEQTKVEMDESTYINSIRSYLSCNESFFVKASYPFSLYYSSRNRWINANSESIQSNIPENFQKLLAYANEGADRPKQLSSQNKNEKGNLSQINGNNSVMLPEDEF